jgi:ornithine decarboxylase
MEQLMSDSDKFQIVDRIASKTRIYPFEEDDDIYSIITYFLQNRNNCQPFYIVDLSAVMTQYRYWTDCLPRVQAYYAIKSNPDPMILYVLAGLGCGFDCASNEEISMAKSQGVDKIIYANPCKKSESLQYARDVDVDILTFDSLNELDKIRLNHPDAVCVIRIAVDDSGSECRFNAKFGCSMDEARKLLTAAIGKINVAGISWHVGSNCKIAGQFLKAFKQAREVYDMATEMGFKITIIDIGGGFPGTDTETITFRAIAEEINTAIDRYFSDETDITFIGEPGRFMCASSHTLVNHICGIKDTVDEEGDIVYKYTIDDTIYGSYNCIIYDHVVPQFNAFNERGEKTYKTTIAGHSCDSMDMNLNGSEPIMLPKLATGDKVFVPNFGAYTSASASSFNGFRPPAQYYIVRE